MSTVHSFRTVMAILSVILLSGCYIDGGAQQQAETAASKITKLRFVYAGGDPSLNQVMQEIVDSFNEQNPDILIQAMPSEVGMISYEDYLENLNAVGEFPDFLELQQPEPYIRSGMIAELPQVIAERLDQPAVIDNKIYTAPLAYTLPNAIYYNKTVFRDADILQPPATWNELLAVCNKLKTEGISPITVAGKDPGQLGYWVNYVFGTAMYTDNPNWNRDKSAGLEQFDHPDIKAGLMKLEELWQLRYVHPAWLYTSEDESINQLINGNAGMLFAGPKVLGSNLQTGSNAEIGVFILSDNKGRRIINVSEHIQGIALTAEAAVDQLKKDAFGRFMAFFYEQKQYERYIQVGHLLSATKRDIRYSAAGLTADLLAIARDPQAVRVQQMQDYWGENAVPNQFASWFLGMMQYVLATGRPTVEQLLPQADEQWTQEKTRMDNF